MDLLVIVRMDDCKIASAVIEAVAVFVVYLHTGGWPGYLAVHLDLVLVSTPADRADCVRAIVGTL